MWKWLCKIGRHDWIYYRIRKFDRRKCRRCKLIQTWVDERGTYEDR